MIESAWSLALDKRKREKEEYYQSGDQQPVEQTPTTLSDVTSLEMGLKAICRRFLTGPVWWLMSEARKNATIRKIVKHVQKIRSQHKTERIATTGCEDDTGDDTLPHSRHTPMLWEERINAEQQGKELGPQRKGDCEGDGGPKMNGGRERNGGSLVNYKRGQIEAGHCVVRRGRSDIDID
ncbi:hypothetical protein HOY80DRAFT_1006564 [Tuber brumale]|nr:hypothetical protein HOY80DRAFT_1006564 [Tuber brumale]